jgi:hypothetical protein
MPGIDLSEALYKRLLLRAESFEDTAESVIERLLDEAERHHSAEPEIPPKTGKDLLPETEYWLPILQLLDEAGGQARSRDVIDALERRLGSSLRANDHDVLEMGEIRWRNRARFARLRMKELGLVSSKSPRGIWEITEKGRRFLEEEGR